MFKKIKDFFKYKKENIQGNIKERIATRSLKNYKIKDDKIIANYGLFQKEVLDNTEENIELLNNKLREQYENTNINQLVNNNKKWDKATFITSLSGIAFSLINVFLTPIAPWVAIPSFILANTCFVGFLASMVGYYKSLSDINKFNKVTFLDNNKDELNEEIKHSDSDTLTKKKIKYSGLRTQNTILKEKHENREIFDINTINKMSLDGLKQVKANLEALKTPVVENADGPKLVLENK